MKRIATITSLSLTLAAACCSVLEAQPAPPVPGETGGYPRHLDQVAELYGSDAWSAGDRMVGLPLLELTFPGFLGEAVYDEAGRLERHFQGQGGLTSFHLEVEVGEDARRAHAVLLEWLAGLSSTAPAPDAQQLGLAVGDHAYVGLSGAGSLATEGKEAKPAVSWIAFVRGNVAVRVSATDPRRRPQPDLPQIAAEIDRRILAQDRLAPNAVLPRPVIARLQVGASRCVAGEVLPLDLHVVGSAGAPAAITWTVGGPGQGYVERRVDGVWRLYTTGPGKIRLSVTVTGRLGTRSSPSRLEIEVADD